MTEPVVAAVDGSPESLAAAAWAGAEAALHTAPLRLLTVWQPPVSGARFASTHDRLRAWEAERMREAAEAVAARRPGLTVTTEQAAGTPMRLLLDAGAVSKMIVLGSRGLGGTAGFFYGCVGLHVLAHCERPVVLVRATDRAGSTPDRAGAVTTPGGAAGTPPGSAAPGVVLGLDLGRDCGPVLSFAFGEAAARRCALRVVHVRSLHQMDGYGAPPLDPAAVRELHAEQQQALAAVLAPWRARFPAVDVVADVVDGPVAGRLVEAARAAGLLVVGRRSRHAAAAMQIGPVTHGVVHHAATPVAVVPHG